MESTGLFGRRYLDIEERKTDVSLSDDAHVVVKVRACGVCGTDVNFVRDHNGPYLPLGHEIAAEVIEVGASVTTVALGDRVVVEDCTMCGVCSACKSGEPQFCRNMYDMEGQPGMGQYLSVRSNCLNRFEGLDYVTACLTEPLAVSLTAVLNAEIPLGGSVLVLGPGPLGLMAAQLARVRGAGFVGITGNAANTPQRAARLAMAEKLGCDMVIQVGQEDVEDAIKKRFPAGVDRVIVSSPPGSLADAVRAVRFGGIVTFFGLDLGGENVIPMDVNELIFRKITLRPTFAEPAINFPVAVRLLQDGLVDASALVTHTFGFEDAHRTYSAIVDGSLPIIKAVMLPNG